MFIESIKIENFRGLNIEISGVNKKVLIIGKNDSGKTSLCMAIRKVLDYEIRRIPFVESDSTNFNKAPIVIELQLNLEGITDTNKNRLGTLIDYNESSKQYFLNVKLISNFNSDSNMYEEELHVGKIDETVFPTNKFTPIDKAIDVVYVNPVIDVEKQKKDFFVNRQQKSIDNDEVIMPIVKNSVDDLNGKIQDDPSIIKLVEEINLKEDFSQIFDNIEFKIKSNIDIANIYKSMDIYPYVKGTTNQVNIGDGKTKALSILLQKLSRNEDKQKIFIVEEPENHLYPLLQQHYASLIDTFNNGQIIYTSHSPFIIDFEKMNQIIKLIAETNENGRKVTSKSLNISTNDYKTFGYMQNTELAEIMYYDKVLLVEGYSEKYFYNILNIVDERFRNYLVKNNMGIFSVYGIDFAPAKKFLEKIGIEVFIKTDNDIFKVPKIDEYRYAGLERCFECLDDEGKKKFYEIVGNNNDKFRFAKGNESDNCYATKMGLIVELFYKYNVILSNHNEGFEKDFLEYLGRKDTFKDDFEELRESKLKNLHKFVMDNKIDVKITKSNKNNPLVRFVNVEFE